MVQYTVSFLQEICFHSLSEDRGTITYSRTILYDTDLMPAHVLCYPFVNHILFIPEVYRRII
jgi:hypothetical protein